MLETLTGIPQILKIHKKKSCKSISFILILQLLLEDLMESIYYIFKPNPIWFIFENRIILFTHILIFYQFLYFEYFKKFENISKKIKVK